MQHETGKRIATRPELLDRHRTKVVEIAEQLNAIARALLMTGSAP